MSAATEEYYHEYHTTTLLWGYYLDFPNQHQCAGRCRPAEVSATTTYYTHHYGKNKLYGHLGIISKRQNKLVDKFYKSKNAAAEAKSSLIKSLVALASNNIAQDFHTSTFYHNCKSSDGKFNQPSTPKLVEVTLAELGSFAVASGMGGEISQSCLSSRFVPPRSL